MLTQKHAWPLLPESLRGSVEPASGWAHQLGVVKGIGSGTVPFQGATTPSIACRGLGWVTAAWPRAVATSPARARALSASIAG